MYCKYRNTYSIIRNRVFFSTRLVKCFFFIIIFCLVGWGGRVNAYVDSVPAVSGNCPSGSKNVAEQKWDGTICWYTWDGSVNGNALFGAGANFTSGNGMRLTAELGSSFAPFDGVYWLRAYLCPSVITARCTAGKSSEWIGSVNSIHLNASSSILSQNPDAGGSASTKSISYSFNMCYALTDSYGALWTSTESVMCQPDDVAHSLPAEPAICYINYQNDLDVSMGSLERHDINTSIEYGHDGNVKKQIVIYCHGDSSVTVTTAFSFTSIIVNGKEVISTSSENLGVAVFYNGNQVGPSSPPVTETFSTGETNRELEFQAVRDPDIPSKDIPTGDFSASAVMIMTEQ